ncbi:Cation efflux family protein [Modicisalibacter muralis]|uniref:Cation efflux family protein n=1 Tax=Modicisalibacter muralis TaxID=119000 RepID=A0A1G9KDH0_9GAMM|nr:cation transporter [Halomonas muralis]SDL47669.1 Cation efflux family protein [Halomonas muralis]
MSARCCANEASSACQTAIPPGYRKVLWFALVVNGVMFAVEIGAGLRADSVSLLADSMDFLGDAANYAISLGVLGLGLVWRARASLIKALTMAAFGVGILGITLYNFATGSSPHPPTMGAIGLLAMLANFAVLGVLLRYRHGDSNMRGVWLCTRNDVIGNAAVLLAALGVFGSGSAWPDLVVGAIFAGLALSAAVQIARQATSELRRHRGEPREA